MSDEINLDAAGDLMEKWAAEDAAKAGKVEKVKDAGKKKDKKVNRGLNLNAKSQMDALDKPQPTFTPTPTGHPQNRGGLGTR